MCYFTCSFFADSPMDWMLDLDQPWPGIEDPIHVAMLMRSTISGISTNEDTVSFNDSLIIYCSPVTLPLDWQWLNLLFTLSAALCFCSHS